MYASKKKSMGVCVCFLCMCVSGPRMRVFCGSSKRQSECCVVSVAVCVSVCVCVGGKTLCMPVRISRWMFV